MGKFLAVVDYGLGNLRSVSKALESVGAQVKVTNQKQDLSLASAIVLPGVGAFQRAMENLKELKLIPAITRAIEENKPFLGICLGLQILFTQSSEHGRHKGLDIIKGRVEKFASGLKIPHMGWNQVKIVKKSKGKSDLFENIANNSYFYFVHSYYVVPEDKDVVVATTTYGKEEFACSVNQGNVWGVQFHPEKSEKLGLQFLSNFLKSV